MKKFESVGAFETNPKWDKMIERQYSLYVRENDMRSPFERDNNRIIHSTVYRRLKNKTQVFYSPLNDNICTTLFKGVKVEK